jgi:predicted NBD/HSP70 family sugar kinase
MQKKAKKQTSGALPAHVRIANIERVVNLMRRERRFAKIDLTRSSGISTTTMTKLFGQLESAGLIEKDAMDRESFGRPRTFYRLATQKTALVAAVVDIEETTAAVFSINGEMADERIDRFPTGGALRGFYARFARSVATLVEQDGRECLQLAVSMPGLIDAHSGTVAFCPNLHWLEKSRPVDELQQRLAGIPVMVVHEEKALCCAWQRQGGNDNFVLLDFSSGVGAGVFCNGELLSGHSGFAGEIGHITVERDGTLCGCGNRGCLETVASDSVYRRLRAKLSAARAAERVMQYQAIGVAAAINLFNPSQVCVHSALTAEVPDYLERLTALTAVRTLAPAFRACRITISGTGKLKGAALCGIDCIFKSRFE